MSSQSAYLRWDNNYIYFDVVLSENHKKSATITEHPVESGADIADHVRVALDEVTLEGFVSNNPIYTGSPFANNLSKLEQQSVTLSYDENILAQLPVPVAAGFVEQVTSPLSTVTRRFTATVLAPSTPQDYVSNTLQVLDSLRQKAIIVSVYCPNVTYQNMLIQNIQMTRDPESGLGAKFSVELKEIRIVKSSITDAPSPSIPTPRPVPIKPKGPQEEKPITPQKKKTFLKKLSDLSGGSAST